MKLHLSGKIFQTAFLFIITIVSMISLGYGSQPNEIISSTGLVVYGSYLYVSIDSATLTGSNKLSLGVQPTFGRLREFPDSGEYKQLVAEANFKLMRIFDYQIQPCRSWDDASKSGSFVWRDVDELVESIFEVGAEPLITLVHCGYGPTFQLPPGMQLDSQTGLPYPESLAAYCTEWIKHFKALGWPVRFYEIVNEVQFYLFRGPWVWNSGVATRLDYYMQLFNTCASAMRSENVDLKISFDFVTHKNVLDYWLANGGAEIDSLNFHKYDSDRLGEFTDQQLFSRVETEFLGTWPLGRSVAESQKVYYNARGRMLPIINSETNLNAYCNTGSDPRIVKMTGAVWTALLIRMEILEGISYNVYFTLAASKVWEQNKPDGGNGFGLINADDKKPWYPYYVNKLIGTNLAVGDAIVDSSSSSGDIRSLAWRHQGMLNMLLICKVDEPRTLYLQGVTGQLNLYKVDNTIPWTTPSIQTEVISSSQPIDMQGYTVALLQWSSS